MFNYGWIGEALMKVRLLHGTSSANAERILEEGFMPSSYFCTDIDDAVYYAATGGEADLQRREELWQEGHGFPPREEYGPETMLMMQHLYPLGARPVVMVVELEDHVFALSRPDSGAAGGIRMDDPIPASAVIAVHEVDWEMADVEGYDPLPVLWAVPDGEAEVAGAP